MNIVVLVKQVPDTETERKLDPADSTVDRAASDGVINELDEYAIEEALRLKEKHGGEVTILTVGPEQATDSIRKALSMGADKAVHVCDDALAGSDALQTATRSRRPWAPSNTTWSSWARSPPTPEPVWWVPPWPSTSACRSSPSRTRSTSTARR